jgi:hypothetical protein
LRLRSAPSLDFNYNTRLAGAMGFPAASLTIVVYAGTIDTGMALKGGLPSDLDRGRESRLTPPPSEPCRRISRTRLSSWWCYLEED